MIRIKDTRDTLTVSRAIFNSTNFNSQSIQAIEFSNGRVLEWNDFVTAGLLKAIDTDGDDTA